MGTTPTPPKDAPGASETLLQVLRNINDGMTVGQLVSMGLRAITDDKDAKQRLDARLLNMYQTNRAEFERLAPVLSWIVLRMEFAVRAAELIQEMAGDEGEPMEPTQPAADDDTPEWMKPYE